MCRMIAGAGVVSLDYLAKGLRQMAVPGHVDGWGYAFRREAYWYSKRSAASCLRDENLDCDGQGFSDLAVFHARKARSGPDVRFTHPLGFHGFLLFHNTRFSNGDYDPERLTVHLEKYVRSEGDFANALSKLEDFHGANLILVSSNKILVGVCHNDSDYYRMHFSSDRNGVLVSSEPLPGRDWIPLEDRSLVTLLPDGSHERITF